MLWTTPPALTVEVGNGIGIAAWLRDVGVLHDGHRQLAVSIDSIKAKLHVSVHDEVHVVFADQVPAWGNQNNRL